MKMRAKNQPTNERNPMKIVFTLAILLVALAIGQEQKQVEPAEQLSALQIEFSDLMRSASNDFSAAAKFAQALLVENKRLKHENDSLKAAAKPKK